MRFLPVGCREESGIHGWQLGSGPGHSSGANRSSLCQPKPGALPNDQSSGGGGGGSRRGGRVSGSGRRRRQPQFCFHKRKFCTQAWNMGDSIRDIKDALRFPVPGNPATRYPSPRQMKWWAEKDRDIKVPGFHNLNSAKTKIGLGSDRPVSVPTPATLNRLRQALDDVGSKRSTGVKKQ